MKSAVLGLADRCFDVVSAEPSGEADVVITLGGRILADGSLSTGIVSRVMKTAELLNAGVADAVILTGGSDRQGRSESLAMKTVLRKHLKRQGLSILIEDESQNTAESARNCIDLMRLHEWDQAILVTSPYHVSRAVESFRSRGANVTGCSAFLPECYDLATLLYVISYEIGARLKRAFQRIG